MAGGEAQKEMQTVVLYPSPGMGHLVSMFELGKLLVQHGFAVTIIIVEPPFNTGDTASFIARASAANPSIVFHRLPTVAPPPTSSPHVEARGLGLLRLTNPLLLDYLSNACPRRPQALIIDFFCCYCFDAAAELKLPCYMFFTSGAGVLAAFYYLPELHLKTTKSFRELDNYFIDVPGIPPLPANHMPLPILDRDDDAYKGFLSVSKRFPEATGIIINTFDALEPRTLQALNAGLCTPEGKRTAPIYSIGPLIKAEEKGNNRGGGIDCLSWLNNQPSRSVVFLCFGSIGVFTPAQVKEIALGLENSGQRFLWVVRTASSNDPTKLLEKPTEPDLEALLPQGFLERTRERGLVVKSWAPQTAVLGHDATGGFVTHCGWNSVLESVMAGVPMIAWPLYAEQKMNKVFLVKELKLAVEMNGYDEEMVNACEIEERVKWLMESEGGMELKRNTAAAKEAAVAALRQGGSSHNALLEVVDRLRQGV